MPGQGYCEPADVDLGNITLGDNTSIQKWITNVSDEIDGKLGILYHTPINLDSLPVSEAKLLKSIAVKMTLGRILSILGAEGQSQDETGLRFLREGLDELHMIADGTLALSAPRAVDSNQDSVPDETGIGAPGARTPTIVHADGESLVEGFYRNTSLGQRWVTAPYWRED